MSRIIDSHNEPAAFRQDSLTLYQLLHAFAIWEKSLDPKHINDFSLSLEDFDCLILNEFKRILWIKNDYNDTIEGFCIFSLNCDIFNPKFTGYLFIEELYIPPHHRGEGLATALLTEASHFAHLLNLRVCLHCLENNDKAQNLYRKFGFVANSALLQEPGFITYTKF